MNDGDYGNVFYKFKCVNCGKDFYTLDSLDKHLNDCNIKLNIVSESKDE